ncbi:peptide deformylase [Aneurinibacillus sp. Ricciae_BoGa-3]|uniref:peptide deformylase n=1 Tax=Aneurinibacillus sp. Ricciae_BoGa-3 TaxID=3022697 RepID=UPI0023406B20|nr:peptide deformylase [Aneurinibacillus sp. Ricciae_BoGa-3]WCK55200.1 peptide deformylase [Aneurinibacillus sp. Ricciae_BoGa-3]
MAKRPIIQFGDPILRTVASPVPRITSKILQLLDDMADTLYAARNGVGLAAPQIGVLQRIIVVDVGQGLIELINPEIIEWHGQQAGLETCLSFPKFAGLVKRAKSIKVTSLNRKGEKIFFQAKGALARCIQHEIDHLNGVLFVDHVQEKELFHQRTHQKISLLDVIRLTKGQ